MEVEKRDEPYIFPKLTEIEIKATQKQKKAMLKALEKMDKKKFAYIPSGEFEHNGKMTSVQSFVIQTTEVSNLEYRTFLFDLLMQNRKEEFLHAKPDQQQWNTLPGGLHSKMVEYYFSHPAYDNYPVVNISREGAEMYCVWLKEELEKVADEKKKSSYHPIRLPVRAEWVKATSIEVNKQPYPWNGPFMRNKDGLFLANFKQTSNEMAIQGSNKAYSTDVTAPVNSYFPNDYGAHNLSGNVAEMVYNDLNPKTHGTAGGGWMNSAEELKILGPDPYAGITSPHPCIGFRVVMTVTGGW
jgi:formylglycine-generating enzyme required for sulfatase activity